MSNIPSFGRDAKDFLKKLGMEDKQDSNIDRFGICITAIIPLGSEKKTVRVRVSNPSGSEETEFLLLNLHVEELGLDVGAVGEEVLTEIEYYAEVAKAYSSACTSFAFTPSSYSALFKKLLTKGFPKDVSEDAIDCLRRAGFVKEDEIALRRAQIFAEKRWGRSRIIVKLREEGFNDTSMSLVWNFLDETDFSAICAELIRKKYGNAPKDDHERNLMYASLARMGFSTADIRDALKLL